jgi:pimeloyl-ACP methyl ester carboxylesterase
MAPIGTERVAAAWTDIRILDTDRGPIEVATVGSGPAVLVIHGTPGSWRQCFSLAEDLADAYTIVAPSRPGYGRTPLSTGRSFDEQAAAYAAVLDALGIERAAILGASGGAPSALAFAQAHAARCTALVLCCPVVPLRIRLPWPLRYLLAPRGLGEALSGLERSINRRRIEDPRAVDKWLRTNLTPDELKRMLETAGMREDLVAFSRTHLDAPAGLAGVRNDLLQVRSAKRAPEPAIEVAAPTLVMQGDADPIVPLADAQHLAGAISGSDLEVYADAGHAFFFTRRREVNERLRAFLGRVLR